MTSDAPIVRGAASAERKPLRDGERTQEFREALIREMRDLRAFAVSLSGSFHQADDLLQETLLKAWSNSGSFIPGTNMRAWLVTILRNTYYSQYRKRGREVSDTDG